MAYIPRSRVLNFVRREAVVLPRTDIVARRVAVILPVMILSRYGSPFYHRVLILLRDLWRIFPGHGY